MTSYLCVISIATQMEVDDESKMEDIEVSVCMCVRARVHAYDL